MNCPNELTCSRFVDNGLDATEHQTVSAHIRECRACRTLVDSLTAERKLLREAMQTAGADGVIPAFIPRPTIPSLLVWLGWTAVALWGVGVVWLSLADTLTLPAWLSWISPTAIGTGIQVLVSTLLPGSTPMDLADGLLASTRSVVIAIAAIAGFGWLVRNQPGASGTALLAFCLLGPLLAAAPESHAFDLRRDEQRVIVGPDEVIDDTLIVTSEDVLIEGTVTGDLIVAGETIRIRGRIDGLVIAMGESVQLEGTFGGSVLGLGETVDVRTATLASNLFGAGERITVQQDVEIRGNAAAAGEEVSLHGAIGKDLISAGGRVTLLGSVGGSMRGYAGKVELTDSARIAGNLTLRVENADAVVIDPGAVVSGSTEIESWPEERNRFLTIDFYLGKVLQVLAAFLTGLVLFRFVPALADVELAGSTEALVTAGIGALALIATPVLSVVAILTLIGAPLGIMTFLIWLAALYAAGIVISGYAGRLLLPGAEGRAIPLLLGLVLLVVLSNLPFIGGPVKLVVGILGLGMIAQWLQGLWQARRV